MRRLRIGATLLALALAPVALSAAASGATDSARTAKSVPFTMHGARFSVRDHRLTYTLTICTRAKSVLVVRARFVPTKRSRGVITLTPGTTQYQDHGCWPAFVSAPLARTETKHCKPLDCPAIRRHRYRSTVTVTYAHPRETRHAPRLKAVA